VEELYGFERAAEVSGGSESVVAFEEWLEIGEHSLLDGIRAYNEEDCHSLYELHRWLLAQRPPGPQCWEDFHHLSLDQEELVEDGDTIGGLELVGEPVPVKKSLEYTFTFEPQEHKLGPEAVDTATERLYHVRVDDERGTVTLRRGV
jgi:hypothetical protein